MVRTIAELFYESIQRELPDALAYKQDGKYIPIPHAELQAQVERMALALHARGLRQGDHVAILSENRPEWAVIDLACAVSGLPDAPIYSTLNAAQAAYILKDSEAKWVFCSNRDQLQKVMDHWQDLPNLEAVVLIGGEVRPLEGRTLLDWTQLMAEGAAQEARRPEVRQWAKERKPEEILTLIYTSGTTGDPKGAVLTHGNLASNVVDSLRIFPLKPGDRSLSFLPLTHILERMAGHYSMIHAGASIYYAESVGSVAANLPEVQPTVLCSVPRIYEKIYDRIMEGVAASSPLKKAIFHWALGVGKKAAPAFMASQEPKGWLGLQYRLAQKLVFQKIQARTGGRLRFGISGGAPLSPLIAEFFWALGIPILEGYGLTETSPVISFNPFGQVKLGTVGRLLYEQWEGRPFVKIAPDGEILCQGPNIMKGYWKNEQATKEAIDAEGYFHTGDIGELDAEGYLKITDRKKEIIVTSGGKKIAPQPIENALKLDKYIAQAVLLGDKRNFIAALIVPNFDALRRWAGFKQLSYASDAELVALPLVKQKIMSRVERVNTELSNYERIKKICLLAQEMTPESDELTPTLKVKRRVVVQKYAELIEGMYGGNTKQAE